MAGRQNLPQSSHAWLLPVPLASVSTEGRRRAEVFLSGPADDVEAAGVQVASGTDRFMPSTSRPVRRDNVAALLSPFLTRARIVCDQLLVAVAAAAEAVPPALEADIFRRLAL